MQQAVHNAVNTFISFFHNAAPLEAMAAVGLGSELFAGTIMGTFGQGLRHPAYNGTRNINTAFWDVHADIDESRHYALCRAILERFDSPQQLEQMWQVGRYIALSEAAMYRGIYEEHKHADTSAVS